MLFLWHHTYTTLRLLHCSARIALLTFKWPNCDILSRFQHQIAVTYGVAEIFPNFTYTCRRANVFYLTNQVSLLALRHSSLRGYQLSINPCEIAKGIKQCRTHCGECHILAATVSERLKVSWHVYTTHLCV